MGEVRDDYDCFCLHSGKLGKAHGFQTVMLCVYGELHIEKARRQLDVQRAQKVRSG